MHRTQPQTPIFSSFSSSKKCARIELHRSNPSNKWDSRGWNQEEATKNLEPGLAPRFLSRILPHYNAQSAQGGDEHRRSEHVGDEVGNLADDHWSRGLGKAKPEVSSPKRL